MQGVSVRAPHQSDPASNRQNPAEPSRTQAEPRLILRGQLRGVFRPAHPTQVTPRDRTIRATNLRGQLWGVLRRRDPTKVTPHESLDWDETLRTRSRRSHKPQLANHAPNATPKHRSGRAPEGARPLLPRETARRRRVTPRSPRRSSECSAEHPSSPSPARPRPAR